MILHGFLSTHRAIMCMWPVRIEFKLSSGFSLDSMLSEVLFISRTHFSLSTLLFNPKSFGDFYSIQFHICCCCWCGKQVENGLEWNIRARNESNFMFYGKTFELHEQEHQQDRLWHYKIVANGEKINRFHFLFTVERKKNIWKNFTLEQSISQIYEQ